MNQNKLIKLPNITNIIQYAIELTEQQTKLSSQDKKQYALKIILETIKSLPDSSYSNYLLNTYDNNTISDLIDLVVNSSKGKLEINKPFIKRVIKIILKLLLSCFKKEPEQ
jgi:hypothetical protein